MIMIIIIVVAVVVIIVIIIVVGCCCPTVSKNSEVLTHIINLQNIKSYEHFFSGLELLNEDTWMDRQTDKQGETVMCSFEGCHKENGTSYCSPTYREVTTQSELSLTLQKQSTACGTEAEHDHSSHSYITLCPHQPFQFLHTTNAQNLST